MKPLEQRKNDFYQDVAKFRNTHSPELLREFFDYWTEANLNGKKMRFEMQKVFDIPKRLGRWKHNQETRFGTTPKTNSRVKRRFPNHYDPVYENKLPMNERQYYWQHLKQNGWRPIRRPGLTTIWEEVAR